MITKGVITVVCLLLAAGVRASGPPTPAHEPLAITIVWDASANAGPYWPSFHSICRQSISTLQPGDRVEIISAHAGRPALRLSETIKSGDSREFESICTVLQSITCPFLLDAHVEKAVDLAIRRLDDSWANRGNSRAILIVVTKGNLNGKEVNAIRRSGEQFNRRRWRLYVTGAASTTRDLLIAANQGIITWSLIEQAQPAAWIRQLRGTSITAAASDRTPSVTMPARQNAPTSDHPPAAASRSGMQTPSPIPSEPKTNTTEGTPGEYSLRTTLDLKVSGKQPSAADSDTSQTRSSTVKSPAAGSQREPKQPAKVSEPPKTPTQSPSRGHSLWSRIKRLILRVWPWIAAVCVLVLAVLGYLTLQGRRLSQQWRTRTGAGIKESRDRNERIVVATVNGQKHHLGRFDRFASITIGSDETNALRIIDKTVSGRHLRLYRKGDGLILQNIGKPITLNSISLRPKAKQRLVLPATIDLSETTRLTLSLLRPSAGGTAEQEMDHERATVQQLA